jgi:hypothetical protein
MVHFKPRYTAINTELKEKERKKRQSQVKTELLEKTADAKLKRQTVLSVLSSLKKV